MVKKITIEAIDFHEATQAVEEKYGRKTRDWAGKWYGENRDRQYQDFWHKVLDYCNDIHNGCKVYLPFNEMAEYFKESEPDNYPWIKEICDAYIDVLGPELQDPDGGEGEYIFWIEW
jgi:hypothetical protein